MEVEAVEPKKMEPANLGQLPARRAEGLRSGSFWLGLPPDLKALYIVGMVDGLFVRVWMPTKGRDWLAGKLDDEITQLVGDTEATYWVGALDCIYAIPENHEIITIHALAIAAYSKSGISAKQIFDMFFEAHRFADVMKKLWDDAYSPIPESPMTTTTTTEESES